MNLAPGADFGPYRLLAFIGEGGFGEVWQATDTRSGETVALKVFSGRFGSEGKERLRAELEVLAANAIGDQQHVVRVLAGGAEPAPNVVMERLLRTASGVENRLCQLAVFGEGGPAGVWQATDTASVETFALAVFF